MTDPSDYGAKWDSLEGADEAPSAEDQAHIAKLNEQLRQLTPEQVALMSEEKRHEYNSLMASLGEQAAAPKIDETSHDQEGGEPSAAPGLLERAVFGDGVEVELATPGMAEHDVQDLFNSGGAGMGMPLSQTRKYRELPKEEGGGIDLFDDGGSAVKRELTAGRGWRHPSRLALVVAEVSVAGGAALELCFSRADDAVVAGWPVGMAVPEGLSVAVGSMLQGELADVELKPERSWPQNADGPGCPALGVPSDMERVIMRVKLVSWEEEEELTGDVEGVRRIVRLTKDGDEWEQNPAYEGHARPIPLGTCSVHYSIALQSSPQEVLYDSRLDKANGGAARSFAVDEPGAAPCEALDVCARAMWLESPYGECRVLPEWGFGAAGSAELGAPPDAELHVIVQLVSIEPPKGATDMAPAEKVEQAAVRRAAGNEKFKAGLLLSALARYDLAAACLEHVDDDVGFRAVAAEEGGVPPADEVEAKAELLAEARRNKVLCHTNLAMVLLKLERPEEAKVQCDAALAVPSGEANVKALFRRAQARRQTGDLGGARADAKALLALEPANKNARRELKAIVAAQKEEDKVFSGMFSRENLKKKGLFQPGEEESGASNAAAAAAGQQQLKDQGRKVLSMSAAGGDLEEMDAQRFASSVGKSADKK